MNFFELDFFQSLTILNSILIAILPFAFFRRQKLQEIKYKEIMELNTKTHDITQRADRFLRKKQQIYSNDIERLDYLISRYKKHSSVISNEIFEYKEMWNYAIEKGKKSEVDMTINKLLKKSENIRELADDLLR